MIRENTAMKFSSMFRKAREYPGLSCEISRADSLALAEL